MIDQRLKEFVRLHHIDLLQTVTYQLNKLKNKINENQLIKQLSVYNLTTEQVCIISDILHLLLNFFFFFYVLE